jgi:hypothetical protein
MIWGNPNLDETIPWQGFVIKLSIWVEPEFGKPHQTDKMNRATTGRYKVTRRRKHNDLDKSDEEHESDWWEYVRGRIGGILRFMGNRGGIHDRLNSVFKAERTTRETRNKTEGTTYLER